MIGKIISYYRKKNNFKWIGGRRERRGREYFMKDKLQIKNKMKANERKINELKYSK